MLHTLYIHGWEERQNQNFDQSKKVTDDVFITLAHLADHLLQSPLNIFTIHNCKSILTFVIFSSVSDDTKNSKTGGDFLTCGGCRRKFDLADLTKFVQHKVLDCNKENSKLSSGECIIIIMISLGIF